VLKVAAENARATGISERYHLLPGNAFDVELQESYDLIVLSHFLHHFDPATCERLLERMHAALDDKGRVLAVEWIPDANRLEPAPAAMFSLMMLATTPSGIEKLSPRSGSPTIRYRLPVLAPRKPRPAPNFPLWSAT